MDGFFKRKSPSGDASNAIKKRARHGGDSEQQKHVKGDPHTIVAWNCNGLTSRLRAHDDNAMKAFIQEHKPDVMFVSEVRVAAANNCTSGKPGPDTKWFRSRMRDTDKKAVEDITLVNKFICSKELSRYKTFFSLADTKYAGTVMLVNTDTVRLPTSVRYNLERMDVKGSVHDPDGRVIVAKFETFSILHTYSPNNGWEHEHFERRRGWDLKVQQFMARKKDAGVKIMWVGDLNVAPRDEDLSHAKFFRKQVGGRNAKKSFDRKELKPEDIGQPGCTDAERVRFGSILSAGDMVDGYRELVGAEDNSGFTWRGVSTGKYGARAMRIDHCIVSRQLISRLRSVENLGHGTERVGFMGSDHCPVLIKLAAEGDAVDGRGTNGEVAGGAAVRALADVTADGKDVNVGKEKACVANASP